MALVNCPNCGGNVSDKAAFCPKCGFTINMTPTVETENKPSKEISSGILKKIAAVVIVVAVICVGGFIANKFIPRNIKVSEVSIDSWSFVDDGSYWGDGKYIGSLSSPTKQTFIAVVTKKETDTEEDEDSDTEETKSSDSTDKKPDYEPVTFKPKYYVIMKNGTGSFEMYGGSEPNDYQIDHYLSGKELSADKDFTKIEFGYLEYIDNDEENETKLINDISLTAKKNITGLLFFKIHNKITDVTSGVNQIEIVNGEVLNRRLYAQILPYKTRDNNALEIQDIYFVPSYSISSITYGKFYYSQYEYEYDALGLINTEWQGEVEIPEKIDGLLIYSYTLNKGGDPDTDSNPPKIGVEKFDTEYISNGFIHLYISGDFLKNDNFITPEYSFKHYGYVEVKNIGS